MKYYSYFILIMIIVLSVSCRRNGSPLEIQRSDKSDSQLFIEGLEIEFEDSCSYQFILNFLSGFEEIEVTDSFLGCTFYLYADSADGNYWVSYFENDTTIQKIIYFDSSDSLILKIQVTGENSTQEELIRFSNIKYLEIIKIKEYRKLVYVKVPKNTEPDWALLFKQYSFIINAAIMGIVFDSIEPEEAHTPSMQSGQKYSPD